MRLLKFFLLLTLFSFQSFLHAAPGQVILMRHAEVPEKGNELDPRGRSRAAAFAPYFMGTNMVYQFGTPVVIYVQKATRKYPSLQPMQTVTPLANALNIPINSNFEYNDYEQMVQEVLHSPAYEGKMVLVCWEYKALGDIAKLLGSADAPSKWKSKVFDRLWVFTYGVGAIKFEDLPQKLMYDDSSK